MSCRRWLPRRANSIFYGERLLTTGNPEVEHDRALLARLGMRSQTRIDAAAPEGASVASTASATVRGHAGAILRLWSGLIHEIRRRAEPARGAAARRGPPRARRACDVSEAARAARATTAARAARAPSGSIVARCEWHSIARRAATMRRRSPAAGARRLMERLDFFSLTPRAILDLGAVLQGAIALAVAIRVRRARDRSGARHAGRGTAPPLVVAALRSGVCRRLPAAARRSLHRSGP